MQTATPTNPRVEAITLNAMDFAITRIMGQLMYSREEAEREVRRVLASAPKLKRPR